MASAPGLMDDELPRRLRAERERRHISVRELARRLDVTPSAISQIETAYALGIPTMRVNTGTWGTRKDFDDLMKHRGAEDPVAGFSDADGFQWVIDAYGKLAETAAQRGVLLGHAKGVCAVAVAPDGSWLATGSYDGTAKLWDARTCRERVTLVGHTKDVLGLCSVWGVAISPDGAWLATTGMDDTVRLWDPVTGEARAVLTGHTDGVTGVAVGPDGGWLATTSHDGTRKIWWPPAPGEAQVRGGHSGQVITAATSPDGHWVATACEDGTARVWDLETGAERLVLEHASSVHAVAVAPDGEIVAVEATEPGTEPPPRPEALAPELREATR